MTENSLQIDLSGLEGRWSADGRQVCAVCGFDFDRQDDPDPEEGLQVPLLLFRKNNKEMLTLCWPCATVRMQNTAAN